MQFVFIGLTTLIFGLFYYLSQKRLKAILLQKEAEIVDLKVQRATLETALHENKQNAEEKLRLIGQAQEKLSDTFKALSHDALEKSNRSFLTLAKETLEKLQERGKGDLEKKEQSIEAMVQPVKESLKKLDEGMKQIEKEWKGNQASLKEQMRSMIETEKELKVETSTLVKALRAPIVRGQWGEMQLRRVVELAGMVNHCDFYEQKNETTEEGRFRPDLIVRLPGNKQVIVDAKTPFEAYLDAMQQTDENLRKKKLIEHARHVRQHVTALGKKAYFEKFQPTPEFVVLFFPSDVFFHTALEFDPSLIEVGVEQGVIIATPTTLIGLLRAISYGWKQEKLSENATRICDEGQKLYKRLVDMRIHWDRMGRSLSTAVESYNKAVGNLESRVLVSARKLNSLGVIAKGEEIEALEVIDRIPRQIQAPEMALEEE